MLVTKGNVRPFLKRLAARLPAGAQHELPRCVVLHAKTCDWGENKCLVACCTP
jgi:hypothetical protein